jgi:hypothetical protein
MVMIKDMVIIPACAMLAAIVLSGCASTRVVGEWRNADVEKAGPYNKIFLAAITSQETVRRQMEDGFQAALVSRNASVVPSYGLLPDKAEAGQEQLIKAVKTSGADAALVFRMVKTESRSVMTASHYGPGMYGWYHSAWNDYYAPTSVYQYDVVTLEAKLFDVASEKLVWAVSTETADPGKIQKEIVAYAKLICDRMGKAGLLSTGTR